MISTGNNELSRRYVKALYELGLEQKKESIIKKDLSLINSLIDNNQDFKKIISSPLISPKKHQEILKLISKILKVDKLTENFLFLLSFNKRLNLLKTIYDSYNDVSSKDKDVFKIDVILPNKITKKEESEIEKKLKSDLKKKAKINFVEDKSIVSGCIVKLGSTMIDLSLKSKLDKIINSLK